ncbi:CBS domain-containing protein [Oxalobacteraceae bacterium R-40]|uniref:CBS domain-containing protein n=1 Tax=Keguizhuia sedimenti TaxID=3064264 RepID=A0ABU1BJY1_9BURK|nr:CBS domain-containing protein [Oxalobacteraceae bacterium R-40]
MQLISEIMTYDATFVSPDDTVLQALRKMEEWNIHAVPVCDSEHLVGILSQQDIAGGANGPDVRLANRKVADLMTNEVIFCFEDQSVDDVLAQMSNHHIRHIPVLNRNRELIGIVSLSDLANRVSGLSKEHAQELFRTFGSEQLSSGEMRTHRLASDSADGKF